MTWQGSSPSPAIRRRLPAGIGVLLGLLVIAALGMGSVSIGPGEIASILAHRLGLPVNAPDPVHQSIVEQLRFPRVLLAGLVGAALAISGAALQGLFRNPLADPGLLGVSASAALAAVGAIVFSRFLLGALAPGWEAWLVPGSAFLGALAGTLLIYRLGRSSGQVDVPLMLLLGVAVNAVAGAGIGLMAYLAEDQALRTLTFWGLGSFGAASWGQVGLMVLAIAGAALTLLATARSLDVFTLGESEAGHLGVDVDALKRRVILATALATGAAVAVAGMIGFVGLVVPHLLRLLMGPGHRLLLPASALLGASLLVGADMVSRSLVAPAELPVGFVTALIGGPVFFWLLLRERGRGGL